MERVAWCAVLFDYANEPRPYTECIGSPPLVPRVLDVEKSQVCFIVGTVYMEMSQKPNVLEDVGRDVRLLCILCWIKAKAHAL